MITVRGNFSREKDGKLYFTILSKVSKSGRGTPGYMYSRTREVVDGGAYELWQKPDAGLITNSLGALQVASYAGEYMLTSKGNQRLYTRDACFTDVVVTLNNPAPPSYSIGIGFRGDAYYKGIVESYLYDRGII